MKRSTWHVRAAGLVLGWLAAAATVALFHRQVPAAGWLLVHLLLLGAVSNALLIWTAHFSLALLRLPEPARRGEVARLAMLNGGASGVCAGVVFGVPGAILAGAALVIAAITAHSWVLAERLRRALPGQFDVTVRAYVVAGVLSLPMLAVAAGLATGRAPTGAESRWVLAHALLGLLGWIGIPILATSLTLLPTTLGTRMAPGTPQAARRSLPWQVSGAVGAAVGALAGIRLVTTAGVMLYLIGVALTAIPLARTVVGRRPQTFAAWSLAAGLLWLSGGLATFGMLSLTASDWESLAQATGRLTAALLVGCVAQILLGSLAQLLPAMVGGGPAAARWRRATVERAATPRLVALNLALLLGLLATPSGVRVIAGAVVLAACLLTGGLLARATFGSPPVERAVVPADAAASARRRETPAGVTVGSGGVVVGVAAIVLAVAGGVAIDPAAGGSTLSSAESPAAGVAATGETTTVTVTVEGMRFTPAAISVPAGNRLIIVLHNTGDDTHDLTLDSGQRTNRLAPGDQTDLDVGVVGRPIEGWCSIAGHRQMGMVLTIQPTGATAAAPVSQEHPEHSGHDHAAAAMTAPLPDAATASPLAAPDLMAEPGAAWRPHPARLQPAGRARVHRIRLVATEQEQEVAPGVTSTRWTFGGAAPGPTLRGRVGDRFVITLVNDGTIGHSIDLHAGALAPDGPMRTIQPGEQLVYRFTAERAGAWMYHCGTMPMSMHIANGMFGAVVIDPPGLAPVAAEYLFVQAEGYLGAPGETADAAKITAGIPDLVTFNGYPMQYDHRPLRVPAGSRIRTWVVDAGPNRATSFHVVGSQFDTVYAEGRYLLRRARASGSQALALQPAQGGFVEFTLPEPGHYPFVSHIMSDAERGAHGTLIAR